MGAVKGRIGGTLGRRLTKLTAITGFTAIRGRNNEAMAQRIRCCGLSVVLSMNCEIGSRENIRLEE